MCLAEVFPRISHSGKTCLAEVLESMSHAGRMCLISGGAFKDKSFGEDVFS